MWTVAIVVGVVAGFVLAKLGRLLRAGGRILALVALGAGVFFWYKSRRETAERPVSSARFPVASVDSPGAGGTPGR